MIGSLSDLKFNLFYFDMLTCVWKGMILTCVWKGMLLTCVWKGMLLTCVWKGMLLTCIWKGMLLTCVWKGMSSFVLFTPLNQNTVGEGFPPNAWKLVFDYLELNIVNLNLFLFAYIFIFKPIITESDAVLITFVACLYS